MIKQPGNTPNSGVGGSGNSEYEKVEARINSVTSLPSPTTAGDWVFLASLNEEMLNKEIKLSNDRISWMMTSQSILFGAFCLILINKENSSESAKLLLNVIPFIALVIIFGAFSGVSAARAVIKTLENERSFYQGILGKIYNFEIPDLGCRRKGSVRWTREFGNLPFVIVTSILAFIWLLLLVTRLSIAIKIGDF